MNKRIISIFISVIMVLSFGAVGCFADAENAYVKLSSDQSPEQALTDAGVIEGFPDGELHLERTLTRAQFTKMIVAAFLPDGGDKAPLTFSDLGADFWGNDYIALAVEAGVINGFEDNTFRPDDNVTYEQAIKIVIRMLSGYDYPNYPADYIQSAIDKGIADGMTSVIGECITRKEAVSLIYNTLIYSEEHDITEEDDYFRYYYPSQNGAAGGGASKGYYAPDSAPLLVEEGYAGFDYEPGPVFPVFNTEEYTENDENVFKNALTSPLSTFSIDTDTASYSNMRRYVLQSGKLPPAGSVRTEELINYFSFDNPAPEGDTPFAVTASIRECPWNEDNLLAKIDVQGAESEGYGKSNLVFLVDISGSMFDYNKLPLVKKSLKMLLEKLNDTDTVSIVTYASGTKVALESTPVSGKDKIISALDSLQAGGGTYGEAGINLAYEQAEKNLIDGNNRIILCTDGDFNIGNSSTGDLKTLIEEKREKGIFLTVLGFGMGNYKDNKMETLADYGNGNYAYIDNAREAKKVFIDEMPKTIYTIAKDVKIQVEFNPAKVKEYRLIGYENRVLNNEDFENDKKDAGELGAGATVTALYEIVPSNGEVDNNLKYQQSSLTDSDEYMTVKLRYKDPDGSESKLIELPVSDFASDLVDGEFLFAAAVAELGMILNDSEFKGTATYESVISLARKGSENDPFGFRTEFVHLVDLMKYFDR